MSFLPYSSAVKPGTWKQARRRNLLPSTQHVLERFWASGGMTYYQRCLRVVKATSSVQCDMQIVNELVATCCMALPLKACQPSVVVDPRGKKERPAMDELVQDNPMWPALGWHKLEHRDDDDSWQVLLEGIDCLMHWMMQKQLSLSRAIVNICIFVNTVQ